MVVSHTLSDDCCILISALYSMPILLCLRLWLLLVLNLYLTVMSRFCSVMSKTKLIFLETKLSVLVHWHTNSILNLLKPNFLKTEKIESNSQLKPNAQA
jgi:hypothetical protein